MESRESQHYQSYYKCRNQVSNLTRKIQMEQEKHIAEEAKTHPNKFWNFAKSPTKNRDGVLILKFNTKTRNLGSEKAEVLLNHVHQCLPK